MCACSGETASDSDNHEDARLKSTKKSRDLREKLKKLSRRKAKNDPSSDAESSEEEVQKHEKSKSKAERSLEEEKSPMQKKIHKASPSRELSPSKGEVHKHSRNKTRHEPKTAIEDSSPARSGSVKKKAHKGSHSPSPPHTPPRTVVSSKQKQEKEKKGAVLSEEGSDPDRKVKVHKDALKERDRDYRDRSPAFDVKKFKSARDEASNGAAAMPAKEEEEDDGFHEIKDPRIREKSSKRVDTPQSPIVSTKSSRSSIHGNIESELSSGEDFKVETADWSSSKGKLAQKSKQVWSGKEKGGTQQKLKTHEDGDHDIDKHPPSSPSHSAPRPRTPDYPIDEPEWKEGLPHTPPSEEEEDDRGSNKGGMRSSKKARKLPRRYQIEPGPEPAPGRREGPRHRDGGKDGRQERRYHAQPPSPSPPPQSYSSQQRKRHHHSPPPPAEGFDRRKRRGRAYSPGSGGGAGSGGYQQRRRHSRSPPYPGSPPPSYKSKSPYGGSPPHGYVHCTNANL